MHISIFVYGTWGDLRPHVVLGEALKKQGHEVQVVASPGYEDWVRERGLEFYALSADVNVFSKENATVMDREFGLIKQIQVVRKRLPPILTTMGLECYEATRNSDVLITVEFGLSLLFNVVKANNLKPILINPAPLNRSNEIAFVGAPPMPPWFPLRAWYNGLTYSLLQRFQWSLLSTPRNNISKDLGLPKGKFKDFQKLLEESPAMTVVSKTIFQRPSDWADHYQVTGYLIDDDSEWTPPQELIEFLENGEAPIYIGFGSMPDSKPERTTQIIMDAVEESGKRAIILKGWAGLRADSVPETIHILDYAPHSWLFPKMSALIHHGGAGTTASGFRAGVPMTIVPHVGDQSYWGRLVNELGVGTAPIPHNKINVENLSHAIQTMTSNKAMREKAQRLSEKIQQEDGLAETVKWVSRFLK